MVAAQEKADTLMADPLIRQVVGSDALVGLLERLFGEEVSPALAQHTHKRQHTQHARTDEHVPLMRNLTGLAALILTGFAAPVRW